MGEKSPKRLRKMQFELTADVARSHFNYDPETGLLTRAVAYGNHAPGAPCLSHKGNGYYQVEIGGRNYLVHRVIWLIVMGAWPKSHIDHVDGVGANNRWSNLRDVSQAVNMQNQKVAKSNNKLGLLGVSTDSKTGKHFSRIVVNGQTRYLGNFDTPEGAHTAYIQAKRELHEGNTL